MLTSYFYFLEYTKRLHKKNKNKWNLIFLQCFSSSLLIFKFFNSLHFLNRKKRRWLCVCMYIEGRSRLLKSTKKCKIIFDQPLKKLLTVPKLRKLHWCVKMANFNVIEINRLIMMGFALFIKINENKIKQNYILTKIEVFSLSKFF